MAPKARFFQIQIDDLYACPGSCAGCVLSQDERRSSEPDMSPETLTLTLDRLKHYIDQLHQHGKLVDDLHINYGIGDHLLMPVEYVEDLYHRSAEVIRESGCSISKSAVYFSTSLIGRPNILGPKIEYLSKIETDIRFVPLVVFDPPKYVNDKLQDRYRENIRIVLEKFRYVDLAANLSHAAIQSMNAAEFYELVSSLGFNFVTLNWTPAQTNIFHTTEDMDAITDWLIQFDQISRKNQHLVADFSEVLIASLKRMNDLDDGITENIGVAEVLDAFIHEMVDQSLHIDHLGNLMPKFEAVGDITYGERFRFGNLGNLKDGDIASLLRQSKESMQRRIMSTYLTNKACSSCEHINVCATTGFHVQTKMLSATMDADQRCPHVAADLFDHFSSELVIEEKAYAIAGE